jgi:hypothetical protein
MRRIYGIDRGNARYFMQYFQVVDLKADPPRAAPDRADTAWLCQIFREIRLTISTRIVFSLQLMRRAKSYFWWFSNFYYADSAAF